MKNKKEERWKQRFQNFEKVYNLLSSAVFVENTSELERAGLIQFYELTFELSWKLMKDFLEKEGFIVKLPRQTIKQAFQSEIISDGYVWIDALEGRNKTAHLYDEEIITEIVDDIKQKYYPAIKQLYEFFKQKV